MSTCVVGVDGCKGGWLTCSYDYKEDRLIYETQANFADILRIHADARFIAVDIPIGFTDDGRARQCDAMARRLLGSPRASSVFPAPQRSLLSAPSYMEASRRSFELCEKKITQQAFAIYPKIAEVDQCMTPDTQKRVFEIHPEVCFWRFGNVPMKHPKRTAPGFDERRRLLVEELPLPIPHRSDIHKLSLRGAQPDDLLDATVAALTADRMTLAKAERLPGEPEFDRRGLRMEMVY